MEKLLSILNSFNMGDQLTRLWNFIDANPFMVMAGIMTLATITLLILYIGKSLVCRKAEQLAKKATERANLAEFAMGATNRLWENAEADYKQSMLDFVTELKKDKAEYEASAENCRLQYEVELEKIQHIHSGQMQLLRDELRCLKDDHRREAINKAIEYQRATHIPADLIDVAGKINKFYGGKP